MKVLRQFLQSFLVASIFFHVADGEPKPRSLLDKLLNLPLHCVIFPLFSREK